MKRLRMLVVGFFLTFSFLAAAGTSEADQKWLQAVEKMVTKGEMKVSTPSENRVTLFRDWAEKKGYSLKVTKLESAFRIEVTGKPSKGLAQQ